MTTRGPGRWAGVAAGLVLVAATGCGTVNRRFVVESNVPNAQVLINNRPIGAAPAHAGFDYYGYYQFEVVHPDYDRVVKRVHVAAPWYAYPPFDFVAEVLWPFGIEDVRRQYFELQPLQRIDTGELIQKADTLREQGRNLPEPDAPKNPRDLRPPPRVPPYPRSDVPGALPGPAPDLGPAVPPPVPPAVVPSVAPPVGSSPVGGSYLGR